MAPLGAVAANPELPANYVRVPIIRQAYTYTCGDASLLGVLYYWEAYDHGESTLYQPLGTTDQEGTRPSKIADFAKSLNLDVELRENLTLEDIKGYLARSIPVIVDIQAWIDTPKLDFDWVNDVDDGHYVVLIALDESNAYFMDPSTPAGYAYIPLPEFVNRWHDEDIIDGQTVKYTHLGIAIMGSHHLETNPAPMQYMD